jgi:predicted RNA binding protein YcfA (HicA-like mRNA interferase family)
LPILSVSKKSKLIERLRQRPRDFTWDEACTLMKQCGFALRKKGGSARMFVHTKTKQKVRLHEPHPQNTLLPYMVEALVEALTNAGEME